MFATPIHIIADTEVPVTVAPVITYISNSTTSITISIGIVPEAVSYNIKYRVSPSGGWTTQNVISNGNHTISILLIDTAYDIKATALNSELVESADSNTLTKSTAAALWSLFISQISYTTSAAACLDNGDTDGVYHDGDTALISIGDKIYTDSGGTLPFNGNNKWWLTGFMSVEVSASGTVLNAHICEL